MSDGGDEGLRVTRGEDPRVSAAIGAAAWLLGLAGLGYVMLKAGPWATAGFLATVAADLAIAAGVGVVVHLALGDAARAVAALRRRRGL